MLQSAENEKKWVSHPQGPFYTTLAAEYLFQHFLSKLSILWICLFGGISVWNYSNTADRWQENGDRVENHR